MFIVTFIFIVLIVVVFCSLTTYIYSVGGIKAIIDFCINKTIFHGLSALCRQTDCAVYTEICVLRRKQSCFVLENRSQADTGLQEGYNKR
jgi:hypothetical protein